jgi:hypothetical protein
MVHVGFLELDAPDVHKALCRDQARQSVVAETSAGVANSGNTVIGACLWRSSLLHVGHRIRIRSRLFLFTKPRRQVFQRGLSVADRCLEHRKTICALRSRRRDYARIRRRFPYCLNGLHKYRGHQGDYHH